MKHIKRKEHILQRILLSILVILLQFTVHAQSGANKPAENVGIRKIPSLHQIRIGGELATRYYAATANLLTRQDRYNMSTFRANALGVPGALWYDWPADQFGRWFSVLHVAEGLGWTTASENRQEVLNVILPLQKNGGYFGTNPSNNKDSRIPSGNAFGLRGLMDAYEDTRNEKILSAARQMVKFFDDNFNYYSTRGNNGAIDEYYAHCIDGLVKLYQLGNDHDALKLARRIAERLGKNTHTHHSLSAYRGLLDLYVATGNEHYLQKTKDYLEFIKENRIVTGGVPELLPASEQDEGCALADYVIINLSMFSLTGQDGYLDEAEKTLVNHFFMNQFHTGGFGHRSYGNEIVGGKIWQGWNGQYGSENPGCCSLWGQWALGQVAQYECTEYHDAIEINLYAEAVVNFPDKDITVKIKSDFPKMKKASITILTNKPQTAQLSLRIPAWSGLPLITVNGKKIKEEPVKGRVVLKQKWNTGDVIEISFTDHFRLVPWPDANSSRVAIFKGPLCLSLSSGETNIDNTVEVAIDKTGRLILGPNNEPQLYMNKKLMDLKLRPIADDWISGDVKNPHRLRVLFPTVAPGRFLAYPQ